MKLNNFQKAQRLQCAADDFAEKCTGETKAIFDTINRQFAKLDDTQLATFFNAIMPELSGESRGPWETSVEGASKTTVLKQSGTPVARFYAERFTEEMLRRIVFALNTSVA